FGAHEALARARCTVAEAEVALAMRDLGGSPRPLAAAAATLEAHADHANALQARLIAARRLVLLGRLDEAAQALAPLDARGLSPALGAVAELIAAELALRSLRVDTAHEALARAQAAAERSGVPALQAEVARALATLDQPAARRVVAGGGEQALRLAEVAALLASDALVVDACRRGLGTGAAWQPLARRPVLFALARALAQAWPGDVDREALIADAFRTRRPDDTHRARLRVEIGRLRALVKSMARIEATERGFILQPLDGREVVVLAPPIDGEQASLVALLSDGAAWSTSALALALGASQRTVQRALAELEAEGRVRAIGQARARRWLAPTLAGFTTILLLPAALPIE
ncbi:MAG: helix-turn-helix domain-containing protein, partial [Hydrogenophaga sp.]|nr:helix-turn-helix domain-containing protein [Hydrogenophaga sp.]